MHCHRNAIWPISLFIVTALSSLADPAVAGPLLSSSGDCLFLATIQEQQGWYGTQNVVGRNIRQHPGAREDFPQVDGYFIGVFGFAFEEPPFADPNCDRCVTHDTVHLFETSHPYGPEGFAGPIVQLGHWDEWNWSFTLLGVPVGTTYFETRTRGHDPFYHVSRSATSISEFQLAPDSPSPNAIMVMINPRGHNQVTAIAFGPAVLGIPEPASRPLLLAGLAVLIGSQHLRRAIAAWNPRYSCNPRATSTR